MKLGGIYKGGNIGYSRQNTLLNSHRCRSFDAPCSIQTYAPFGGKIDHAKKWCAN